MDEPHRPSDLELAGPSSDNLRNTRITVGDRILEIETKTLKRESTFFEARLEKFGEKTKRREPIKDLNLRDPWLLSDVFQYFEHKNVCRLTRAFDESGLNGFAQIALIANKLENYELEQLSLFRLTNVACSSSVTVSQLVAATCSFELEAVTQNLIKSLTTKVKLTDRKQIREVEKLPHHSFGYFLVEYQKPEVMVARQFPDNLRVRWQEVISKLSRYNDTENIHESRKKTDEKYVYMENRPEAEVSVPFNTIKFLLLDAVAYKINYKTADDEEKTLIDYTYFVCEKEQHLVIPEPLVGVATIYVEAKRRFRITKIQFENAEGIPTTSLFGSVFRQPKVTTESSENFITPYHARVLFDGGEFPEFFLWKSIPTELAKRQLRSSSKSPAFAKRDKHELRIIFFQPFFLKKILTLVDDVRADLEFQILKLEKPGIYPVETQLQHVRDVTKYENVITTTLDERAIVKEIIIKGYITHEVPSKYERDIRKYDFDAMERIKAAVTTFN